jgi:hypothetical protein
MNERIACNRYAATLEAREKSASPANSLILQGTSVRSQRGSGADQWVRIESENGGTKA